jgi:hypothetical protein
MLRRWFLARLLITFIALSLLSVVYTVSRPSSLFLAVEVSGPQPSTARLFYDTGNGFSDLESSGVLFESPSSKPFSRLYFILPRKTIVGLRLRLPSNFAQPANGEASVRLRGVRIFNNKAVLTDLPVSRIAPYLAIASCTRNGDEVAVITAPHANDAAVAIALPEPLQFQWLFRGQNLLRLGVINLLLIALFFAALLFREPMAAAWSRLSGLSGAINSQIRVYTGAFSADAFVPVDALAVRVYGLLLILFAGACALNLNGSSSALYGIAYKNGPAIRPWMGSPKASRSDEWAYTTPDILNQYFRRDRFAAQDSVLGNHYIALTGNVPVKDVSTFFRPQFWAFFLLPLSDAYSIYWQAKGLVLVGGVFTFLLWLTRSSGWALAGALWYFFSPFTQWSYSWPSALPEMVGSLCLGSVCFCYLTVGRKRKWLAVAAIGTLYSGVNFAMCAYLPHMIPLSWLSIFIIIAWCFAARREILNRQARVERAAVMMAVLAILCAVGAVVYSELRTAIFAVAETAYPGRRITLSGTMPPWKFLCQFLQWTVTEKEFPQALGNICEGSGFLWLAPVTLLVLPKLRLPAFQKAALIALWCCAGMLFAWSAFDIPPAFGRITLMERSTPARSLAALGLANVAIVCLAGAYAMKRFERVGSWRRFSLYLFFTMAVCWALLAYSNWRLDHYFALTEVMLSALFVALLCSFFLAGRERAFLLLLVIPQVMVNSTVNPMERGLPSFTESAFHQFVRQHRDLLGGKWLVYSNSIVRSGFVAASGCSVYTGTRYLPDIDHFSLFAARGLDLNVFNRLGYLDAAAIPASDPTRFVQTHAVVVNWNVAPDDPLLAKLGIRYVTFDEKPGPQLLHNLRAVHDGPLDGLWIYEVSGR